MAWTLGHQLAVRLCRQTCHDTWFACVVAQDGFVGEGTGCLSKTCLSSTLPRSRSSTMCSQPYSTWSPLNVTASKSAERLQGKNLEKERLSHSPFFHPERSRCPGGIVFHMAIWNSTPTVLRTEVGPGAGIHGVKNIMDFCHTMGVHWIRIQNGYIANRIEQSMHTADHLLHDSASLIWHALSLRHQTESAESQQVADGAKLL